MNAFLLAIAMVGQCSGGSCPQPVERQVTYVQRPEFANRCVRIETVHGRSISQGSGTVIGSDSDGRELIITARHVLGSAQAGWVKTGQGKFVATRLSGAGEGDIAALEADLPGRYDAIPIAEQAPRSVRAFGFGSSGTLHQHLGQYLGSSRPVNEYLMDHEYSFMAHQGDSGGGVFAPDGSFSGVIWGTGGGSTVTVSTQKVRQFLQCDYKEKRFALTPIGIFCRKIWRTDPQQSAPPATGNLGVPPPIAPEQPQVVTGPAGPPGPQGLAGKDGQPGKDAPAVDLTTINNRLAALEAGQKAITGTMDKVSQAVQRPITFNVAKSDGTTSTAQAQLGSTVNLDVADKAIISRLTAIEQRLATPTK